MTGWWLHAKSRGREIAQDKMLAVKTRRCSGEEKHVAHFWQAFNIFSCCVCVCTLSFFKFPPGCSGDLTNDSQVVQARNLYQITEKQQISERTPGFGPAAQHCQHTKCQNISLCGCVSVYCPHFCRLWGPSNVQRRKHSWDWDPAWSHSWPTAYWSAPGWHTTKNCNFRTITTYGLKTPQQVSSLGDIVIEGLLQNKILWEELVLKITSALCWDYQVIPSPTWATDIGLCFVSLRM